MVELLAEDLIADVPLGVVIASVCAWVDDRINIFGDGMISEAKLDLNYKELTFSSFCSWVYSYSKLLGTDTLPFHSFFCSPR